MRKDTHSSHLSVHFTYSFFQVSVICQPCRALWRASASKAAPLRVSNPTCIQVWWPACIVLPHIYQSCASSASSIDNWCFHYSTWWAIFYNTCQYHHQSYRSLSLTSPLVTYNLSVWLTNRFISFICLQIRMNIPSFMFCLFSYRRMFVITESLAQGVLHDAWLIVFIDLICDHQNNYLLVKWTSKERNELLNWVRQ